jgi:hypothetical protein
MKQNGGGTYGGFSSQAHNQQLLEDEEQGPAPCGAGQEHSAALQGWVVPPVYCY